jgi:hypothetical protein
VAFLPRAKKRSIAFQFSKSIASNANSTRFSATFVTLVPPRDPMSQIYDEATAQNRGEI